MSRRAAIAWFALWLAGAAEASGDDPWTVADGAGIAAARFELPDDTYPHRIMGRIPERRGLAIRDTAGREIRLDLRQGPTPDHVFEDIAPRIADVTGDGLNDLIVVEADPQKGASLAIYSLQQDRLIKVAATPHIGMRFRWLAPAAIADLDGDGVTDIAYVETPHLGKTLRVWNWSAGSLSQVAHLRGVTNHRIGDEVILGGLRDCGAGPEIVLADAEWRFLLAVRFDGSALEARPLGLPASAAGFAEARDCP